MRTLPRFARYTLLKLFGSATFLAYASARPNAWMRLSLYFAGRRHIPPKLRALVDLIRERSAEDRVGRL
jgi:hypothetical protein